MKEQLYTHAISIEHNIKPGTLWKYKHTEPELEVMRKTDPHVFSGQYMQNPSPAGGAIFKTEWWESYKTLPNFDYRLITVDTAQKDKEVNDFTVFQLWGAVGRRAYLIDQYRGKIEAPELLLQAVDFWNKHVNLQSGILRGMFVEDKVSGTSLIQQIRRKGNFPIIAIQRNKYSKVIRAFNVAPSIASGLVYLPEESEWLFDYKEEFRKITPLMTHKHDDQFDPTADAIEIICLAVHTIEDEPDVEVEDENKTQSDFDYSASNSMHDYQDQETGLF